MEGEESPLDVLSRAATMLQEHQNISLTDDSPKTIVSKQTTKWKRDRRSRLPEYTRKSDPKFVETFSQEAISETNGSPDIVDISNHTYKNGFLADNNTKHLNGVGNTSNSLVDSPIDMSVKQRGLPPSYSQTVNSPSYRSSCSRPPPIITNSDGLSKEEIPSGMSMCDPIIDEHFRRSLGNEYNAIFQNHNISKEQVPRKSPPISPATSPTTPTASPNSVVELMDNAGLSVDEHFAKALGDTWFRLNSKESETKSGTTSNKTNLVSI